MSKITLIVAIMAVICASSALIGSSQVSRNLTGCQQLEQKPIFDLMALESIKSSDNQALVRLAGFYSLWDEDRPNSTYYSPIKITGVQWSQIDEFTQKLTLTDACAEHIIYTHLSPAKSGVREWRLKEWYATLYDVTGAKISCLSHYRREYPVGEHYQMDNLWSGKPDPYVSLSCKRPGGRPMSALDVHPAFFEFELAGNPDVIGVGNFSTPAYRIWQ